MCVCVSFYNSKRIIGILQAFLAEATLFIHFFLQWLLFQNNRFCFRTLGFSITLAFNVWLLWTADEIELQNEVFDFSSHKSPHISIQTSKQPTPPRFSHKDFWASMRTNRSFEPDEVRIIDDFALFRYFH